MSAGPKIERTVTAAIISTLSTPGLGLEPDGYERVTWTRALAGADLDAKERANTEGPVAGYVRMLGFENGESDGIAGRLTLNLLYEFPVYMTEADQAQSEASIFDVMTRLAQVLGECYANKDDPPGGALLFGLTTTRNRVVDIPSIGPCRLEDIDNDPESTNRMTVKAVLNATIQYRLDIQGGTD